MYNYYTDEMIQDRLFGAYMSAKAILPKDFDRALKFLETRKLHKGICYYALEVLEESVGHTEWFKQFEIEETGKWAKNPEDCKTIEEIRECILIRINNLDKLLEK